MMLARTLVYHAAKSTSFLTPMAIWTAPSIFASSFSAFAGAGLAAAGAAGSDLSAAKSTMCSFDPCSGKD